MATHAGAKNHDAIGHDDNVANQKGTIMRRKLLQIPVFALLALVALAGISARGLAAQQATPAPLSVIQLAPGVTAEVFAGTPSDRASGQTVYLARFVFQPGAAIFPHSHPGTTTLGVDSGDLGWTLLKGTAHVVRGAGSGGTQVEDLTQPNTEVILHPGDAIYYEDDVVHTARGAGNEPAVVYSTLVLTTGQPLLMPAGMNMGAATATP
jgi:quercetin dioxygenase-like cupin family protein